MQTDGFTLGCVCVFVAACAHAPTESRLIDLDQRLKQTAERAARAERKAEELEDRLFLLTDQIESQRVEAARRNAPPLPIIRLKPNEETATEGDVVGFEGEAKSSDPERVQKRPGQVASVGTTRALQPSPKDNLGKAPAPPIDGAEPSGKTDPATLYRTAYQALRDGHVEAAESQFGEFLRRFPKHDYADNAQYWIGECYYGKHDFERASAEFRVVVSRYPTGNKAPDALLKLGYSLLAMGREKEGRQLLAHIPLAYPRTDAARLAEERLGSSQPPKESQQ